MKIPTFGGSILGPLIFGSSPLSAAPGPTIRASGCICSQGFVKRIPTEHLCPFPSGFTPPLRRHGISSGCGSDQWPKSFLGSRPGYVCRKLEAACAKSSGSWHGETVERIWEQSVWRCDDCNSWVVNRRLPHPSDRYVVDMWRPQDSLFRSGTGRWVCRHMGPRRLRKRQ